MVKEKNVFSSIKDFDKSFKNTPKDCERRNALVTYFNYKGVVRAHKSEKEWPKLTYPNIFVLEKKLNEIKSKKNLYQKNLDSWSKKFKEAQNYDKNNQIKKLKEPLYWKHKAKMITDADYRKDAEMVKLPVHLVSDAKWKPMVKMFVNDLEYRKQLSETVKESIIYKKDKKVAKYADDLTDFRMKTSNKQIEELEKKILKLNELEKTIKEIHKWAKE